MWFQPLDVLIAIIVSAIAFYLSACWVSIYRTHAKDGQKETAMGAHRKQGHDVTRTTQTRTATMTDSKQPEDEIKIMAMCSHHGPRCGQERYPTGPIIAAHGLAVKEIEHNGTDLLDINLYHDRKGVAVWEGRLEYLSSYEYSLDVDISWVGKWRGLTPREWDLMRRGEYPWPDIPPEERWPREQAVSCQTQEREP